MRRLSQFLLQLLVHLRKIIPFGGITASAFTTKIILQGNYKMIFCLLKRLLSCGRLFYDVFDEADSNAVQSRCFGSRSGSSFLKPELASGDRRILGFAPQIV